MKKKYGSAPSVPASILHTSKKHRSRAAASAAPGASDRIGAPAPVSADIVLPVTYAHAAHQLESSVGTLVDFLSEYEVQRGDFTWNIVIAVSTNDPDTWRRVEELAGVYSGKIRALRMLNAGHGKLLKTAWCESEARLVSYVDLSLSTDIKDMGFLLGSLLVGGVDVAIGSRLLSASQVDRSKRRELISRTYNMMLHSYLGASFHDAQCGFKALTAEVAHTLLPYIDDDGLFFDAELLLLAQSAGMLIYEIPVVWTEPKDPNFSVPDTAQHDLEGMRRMKRTFSTARTSSGRSIPWDCSGSTSRARRVARREEEAASDSAPVALSSSGLLAPRTTVVEIAHLSLR